jgi:DNA-directed RNA polymerase subunit RPC12/RpoP
MENIRCASCGKKIGPMTDLGPEHGESVGKDALGRVYYQCHQCSAADEIALDNDDDN